MLEDRPSLSESQRGIFVDGAWRRDWYETFEDQGFAKWLREQGISVPIFEYGRGLYRVLERAPGDRRETLPAGHWYKGGQARSRFMRRFGIPCPMPRDVDIVRDDLIALAKSPTSPLLHEADGLETYGGFYTDEDRETFLSDTPLEDYFQERDFTINEVLANGREIVFTKAALMAAMERRLTPTPFEWEKIETPGMAAVKQLARALRFSIEWTLDPQHPWEIDPCLRDGLTQKELDDHPFYIFLHLDRILERGFAYGVQFLHAWQEHGFFLDERSVLDLATRLAKGVWGNYQPSSPYLREHAHELSFGISTRSW